MMTTTRRTLGLLALVVGAAMAAPAPLTEEYFSTQWLQFKQTHGKSYTPAEEAVRYSIFKEKVQFVNEHMERHAKGLESYTVGINYMADWTPAEYASRNGYVPLAETAERAEYVSNVAAPDTMDWRDKGAVTPVKDQKQCGSCWSFGTTGAIEGQLFLKNKAIPGAPKGLSEQNLVDCDKKDHGCNGGNPSLAYDYVKVNGLESEADYPYTAKAGSCVFNKAKVVAHITGGFNLKSGDENGLKSAVADKGPIAVGIDASHLSFQTYTGGVYDEPACSSLRLDHAVLVVGYGTENGKDYWLIKNSWSEHWGEKGYIKIRRNSGNRCGVATDASYPLV